LCRLYQTVCKMGSKSDSSVSPGTGALAILARIIAREILRKEMDGNRCPEAVTGTDKGAGEDNADTNDENSTD
jgi:hypothetical protein